ncbi:hypothetical protein KORDIASMS9_00405 [Kordia sp. SMS9]|uniref:bZIP transcription factor n=1 Tax=Kordia sp. SMS9 TaxID=2282170 RepID=UPI000E0D9673|nr:bZIP transcription factor [Kordia sp. SMS9]AXG68213.1 hypothetical protein KORDIASMS9_00405 [Kordia sp. SMS9]
MEHFIVSNNNNKTQQNATSRNKMQQIIHHLLQHPSNSISVEYNGRKKMNPYAIKNKYLFTQERIESGWHSVPQFLKGLKNDGFPSGTKIYLRIPNGSTSKVIGQPITLQFSGDIKNNEFMTQEASHNESAVLSSQMQPIQSSQPYYGMGNPMMGVHPAESRLEAITAKYEDLKERYDDLKSQCKDLQSTERQLKEENNSLKLEVNTAEKHKELAILQADLNRKSFMDSDAMKTIAANLAPALPQIISGQPAQIGMGTASNLSSEKKQFIDFITSDRVTDADVGNVYKIYKHMVKNQDFAAAVQQLIIQFQIP